MKRCRHKRLVMAMADEVDFHPDQEPFTSGVVECAGVSEIVVNMIVIRYCPICKRVVVIEAANDGQCDTQVCDSNNRCEGH
jgi:hypothetical protein